MPVACEDLLRAMGVHSPATQLQDSGLRFPDGSECRIEIPSVERPDCLREVRTVAADLDLPVCRVSQGGLRIWACVAF
jgi:hypothetical protein